MKQPTCTITFRYVWKNLRKYNRLSTLPHAVLSKDYTKVGETKISKLCLSEYLIQLALNTIHRFLFFLLILVAKSRNGSASNDRSSSKERTLRRTPSATGQEANQEGTDLRAQTFNSTMSFLFCFWFWFCYCFVLFCVVILIRFFFDGNRGNS